MPVQSQPCPADNSPAALEARHQSAVLNHLLFLYPAQLTLEEVVCELTIASTEFSVVDNIERAARDLIATGLIRRHGDHLIPTRATVRFYELCVTPGTE
jgi:hypothetical protein